MTVGFHALSGLERASLLYQGTAGVSSSIRLDGAGKRIAYKFYPSTTSAITHVNPRVGVSGDVTGATFTAEIQTDSSDEPSGSVLGAATSAWSGPASSSWLGATALGSNTGALSLNTPYWLVIHLASGSVDATNYIAGITHGSEPGGRIWNNCGMRCFNGSDWTTVARSSIHGEFVLTHADGALYGVVHSTSFGTSGATDVFGTNRQGIVFKIGAQGSPIGAKFQTTKASSPAALELVCYEGSTQKAIDSLPAAEIVSNASWTVILFESLPTISPDADCYLILRQASDGGDDSNDYDLRGNVVDSGFIGCIMPPEMRFVSGTGDNPTSLSESGTFAPLMVPLFADPTTGLDSSGSIGTPNKRGGMQ